MRIRGAKIKLRVRLYIGSLLRNGQADLVEQLRTSISDQPISFHSNHYILYLWFDFYYAHIFSLNQNCS